METGGVAAVIDLEDAKSVIPKSTLRDKINGWVNEALLDKITELEHRESELTRREKLVNDIMATSNVSGNIKIVVGSQAFYVHSSVLEKYPDSYFSAMLSGAIEGVQDVQDPYAEKTFFIARSSRSFAIVLNYLLYKVLPEMNDDIADMVFSDSKFYQLAELMDEFEEEEAIPKEKKRKSTDAAPKQSAKKKKTDEEEAEEEEEEEEEEAEEESCTDREVEGEVSGKKPRYHCPQTMNRSKVVEEKEKKPIKSKKN